MKNQLGIIVLILIAVGLSIGLIWSQKTTSKAVERIEHYSNELVSTTATLDNQKKVNLQLENDRAKQEEALSTLTNNLAQTSNTLEATKASLDSAQKDLAARDARIADLESQNHDLDQRASELSNSITNLTDQINDTRRRLAASEGDKETLTRELQRLMSEKATLERQLNDITFLRTQVAKLREEMNVSRRLEWIRKGLYASAERKGAEQLVQMNNAPRSRSPNYDLNVEVNADGTVRVLTNSVSGTTPAPAR